MECLDLCCYSSDNAVSKMICNHYSNEDIQAYLEGRDGIPYDIVSKQVDGWIGTTWVKNQTAIGYIGYGARQTMRFLSTYHGYVSQWLGRNLSL